MILLPRSCAIALAGLLLACASSAQQFEAPSAFVPGDAVSLKLTGLPADALVEIDAQRPRSEWGGPVLFRSTARFRANHRGEVDLETAVPQEGSYQGADLRGLFWSMRPTSTAQPAAWPLNEVRLRARLGEREVAHAAVRVLNRRDGVVERHAEPFEGAALFTPSGKGPWPVIVVLGGSEGGAQGSRAYASLWASHGFAALALPYYSPPRWAAGPQGQPQQQPPELPGLPQHFENIAVDRLEQVHAWLLEQPDIDSKRIALHGGSKGAEFALSAATRMPWIQAVVAVVPTDVVWEGWGSGTPGRSSFSWQGRPFPFVAYHGFAEGMQKLQRGQPLRLRPVHEEGRARTDAARLEAARIPVERFAGPLLLVGGGDDQMWASGAMARRIAERRKAAGLPTDLLVFEEAGHAITGTGWSPTTTANAGPMQMGGTPEADARAQGETFPRMLAFFRQHLRR